jgi:antitoxin VapB
MGLNIKNEEVHRLARELAAQTGETMTQAILHALEDRMARFQSAQSTEKSIKFASVQSILATLPKAKSGATSRHDDLYDAQGLPQ